MSEPTRVLVTNDDGIDGPGLRVLVAALVERGYEPVVVAPDSDYSGAGTSIISRAATDLTSASREILFEKRVLPEAPHVEAYAIGAPPAMCILLALRDAFGPKPDLVASGINHGLNTGGAVRFSGTIGAAMAAGGLGVPSIAVSAEFDFNDQEKPVRYDTAADVAMDLFALLAPSGHQVLNINVPQRSREDLAGIAAATISQIARYRSFVESREDGVLKMGYKMTDDALEPGSDTQLVSQGYATVSSLTSGASVDCSDLVDQVVGLAALEALG